jgi:hypothetical protein
MQNVTTWPVRVTTVSWKHNNTYLFIVSVYVAVNNISVTGYYGNVKQFVLLLPTVSIKYFVCVRAFFFFGGGGSVFRHANHLSSLYCTFICGLLGFFHIFQYYVINGTIFREKDTIYKMCVLISSTTFV